MTSIYQKSDIKAAMYAIFEETAQAVANMDEADFLASRAPKWSAAEIFDHLIRSSKPIATALKMPKIAFRSFGKPNRPSRSYEGLVQRYQERLAEGGRSTGPYNPDQNAEYNRQAMLTEWRNLQEKLEARLDKNWTDEQLDKFLVPHPLLGKLLFREVLFFTIYHTGHHLKQIKKEV